MHISLPYLHTNVFYKKYIKEHIENRNNRVNYKGYGLGFRGLDIDVILVCSVFFNILGRFYLSETVGAYLNMNFAEQKSDLALPGSISSQKRVFEHRLCFSLFSVIYGVSRAWLVAPYRKDPLSSLTDIKRYKLCPFKFSTPCPSPIFHTYE